MSPQRLTSQEDSFFFPNMINCGDNPKKKKSQDSHKSLNRPLFIYLRQHCGERNLHNQLKQLIRNSILKSFQCNVSSTNSRFFFFVAQFWRECSTLKHHDSTSALLKSVNYMFWKQVLLVQQCIKVLS